MAAPLCELAWNSIPADIALKIAYLLEATDLCSLGRCSHFWRGICASDCLWMELAKRRWPILRFDFATGETSLTRNSDLTEGEASAEFQTDLSPTQGWREFYIQKHQSISLLVSSISELLEQCTQNGSLEVGYYLKLLNDLHSYKLGFKDVQTFVFSRKRSVLLNLVGLHYSLVWLQIEPSEVLEALHRNQVSDREVCVSWFKLGRWFYGFRLHDEHRSRRVSLRNLVEDKDDEIFRVLHRGAVHEVLRVCIAAVNTQCSHLDATEDYIAASREEEEEEDTWFEEASEKKEAKQDQNQTSEQDDQKQNHRRRSEQIKKKVYYVTHLWNISPAEEGRESRGRSEMAWDAEKIQRRSEGERGEKRKVSSG
ncbi:hypothetical protein HPP92_025211 [Vanilla planifolia]|uniref:F-box domain-containing protein n=1 Tax=Vanilla planifolia TaxID=51239 RepID=A0A835PLT9_VANPL|nr:hypothetical protein HPP92_025211 [Vanilla planifolia]